MPLRLTYPKSHEAEDLRPYYEEFKRLHPDLFSKWQEWALKPRVEDHEFPREVSVAILNFLRTRVDYESELALGGGFGDFGKLLYTDLHVRNS